MPNYHRYYVPNSIVAFTLVTYNRYPLFSNPQATKLFLNLLDEISNKFSYDCLAFSILPNHIHLLIQLSQEYPNFSVFIRELKRLFSIKFQKSDPILFVPNSSRQKHHEVTIWQRRFWDHIIVDEQDLQNHLDYIHFNPVKHGLTQDPSEWPWSSFSDYLEKGYYSYDWVPDKERLEKFKSWGE